MHDWNTAALLQFEHEFAQRDVHPDDQRAHEREIEDKEEEILTADLGAFCEWAMDEDTRSAMDMLIQAIACEDDDDKVGEIALRLRRQIRAAVRAAAVRMVGEL